MGNYEDELKCLNLTIKNCSQLKNYTIIDKQLRNDDGERPDFILQSKSNTAKIGIEHFLIDTLLKKQNDKSGSENRISNGKITGNELNALKEIDNLINKSFFTINDFDCKTFQEEFYRIVINHCKNIEIYKSKDISKLGFLCEIDTINTNNIWDIYTNGKWHKQAVNVPVTKLMNLLIQTLFSFEFIDFFIITFISTYSPQTAKSLYITKDTKISCVDEFRYVNQNIE